MSATPTVSWIAILALAGGAVLLLGVIIAVVAAVGSKSKSGAAIAIGVVALLLLGLPVLGLLAMMVWAVDRTSTIETTPVQYDAAPAQPIGVPVVEPEAEGQPSIPETDDSGES